jgi:hypothetical protein
MLSNQVVIYSYPRAGTKLIASILESKGYHNYGEYFDTFTVSVANDSATRNTPQQIKEKYSGSFLNTDHTIYHDTKTIIERFNRMDHQQYPRSTVTVWHENLVMFPFLLEKLQNFTWILPQRNRQKQLYSWLVVFYNNNPNGDVESKSVVVDKKSFQRLYYKQKIVYQLQDWIKNNYASVVVDFDRLITGREEHLGAYNVNSADQHANIRDYITNVQEVDEWFADLDSAE